MFSRLSEQLDGVFKKLRGMGRITEKNVTDALREVRLALLEADVDFKVAKDFIETVKTKALGESVLKSVTPGQQIVKIFHDELTHLLGGDAEPFDPQPGTRVLIVGLNGAGKTTTTGKLALWLKKREKRPVLLACDLDRPAAVQQLTTLANDIGVPIFTPQPGERDVIAVVKRGLEWVKQQGNVVALFDTAGRQEVDEALIKELQKVSKLVDAQETFLVADAATGQQAVQVATRFHEAVGVTGLILTKLDGDARGGAALSMRSVTGRPIKFIGTGEKMEALEFFDAERLANRILGMGDVVGLVEKAIENINEQDAMQMASRFMSADFNLEDFLSQLKFMQRLGPLEGLLGMLPGMGAMKQLKNVNPKRVKHLEAIILSMTPKERKRPEILNGKRRIRISKGSGRSVTEVNNLLRQFQDMKKLMKNKGQLGKLMNMFGGPNVPKELPKGLKW